jgi:hypothetical protein
MPFKNVYIETMSMALIVTYVTYYTPDVHSETVILIFCAFFGTYIIGYLYVQCKEGNF